MTSISLRRFGFFLCTVLFSQYLLLGSAISAGGVPLDKDGDTIPAPGGSVPFVKMPDALAGGPSEYTWDYSGTLEDISGKRFSFLSSVFQLDRASGLGFHIFQLGWKDGSFFFNANSTYGGEDTASVTRAISQSLDLVQSSASLETFNLQADTFLDIFNPGSSWTVQSSGASVPVPPLYKGWVGQPGHAYVMTGSGGTFLWRYKSDGSSVIVPYRYAVNISLSDERGVIMEGLGGGYVGPALIPPPTQPTYNTETEIGQPRLRVTDWNITLTAAASVPEGFSQLYSFAGQSGMLWNDFGPVVPVTGHGATHHGAVTSHEQAALLRKLPEEHAMILNAVASADKVSGLYNGNWIPVLFTSGKYQGSSIVFFPFWSKAERRPTGQSTGDLNWCQVAWANLFTGVVPGMVASASAATATLYPENPNPPTVPSLSPPFALALDRFVPNAYTDGPHATIAFPWAQQALITIKANTKLRYVLADYANTYYPELGPDDPGVDLVIEVTAISPVTQHTLFSKSVSQYYEGAAIPTIDGDVVGYAWIEHMVNEN